jgi:hypothetical protein
MRKCADMLMGGGGFEICDCTICDCANKKSVFSMRVFEREISLDLQFLIDELRMKYRSLSL